MNRGLVLRYTFLTVNPVSIRLFSMMRISGIQACIGKLHVGVRRLD